jgi:hypothetical protein
MLASDTTATTVKFEKIIDFGAVQQSPRQLVLSAGRVVTIIIETPLNFISLPRVSESLPFLHPYCRFSMTWRLILLMELQQATSHNFIISMSRRLCLRGRQVMSFQEREKVVRRKVCLRFSFPIGSCWPQNTSQKVKNTTKVTSSRIFCQSWNEKMR